MTEMTTKDSVGEVAGSHFVNGFHCAEAIVAAVLERMGEAPSQVIPHATAFGGGMGRTFEEACGALSGSLITIGHLYGRNEESASWDRAADLGAEIRRRFVDRYGTTTCRTLREKFGEEAQPLECETLVRFLAAELMALLQAETKIGQEHF